MAALQRPSALKSSASRRQQLPLLRAPKRCATARVRAQAPGGGEDRPGQGGTDWDAAWARYQRARGSGGATTRTAPPRSADPNAQMVQNAIRRQESTLLNIWSSAPFQGGMTLVALVVLVAFVAAAGPPPMDDRCTLPWC